MLETSFRRGLPRLEGRGAGAAGHPRDSSRQKVHVTVCAVTTRDAKRGIQLQRRGPQAACRIPSTQPAVPMKMLEATFECPSMKMKFALSAVPLTVLTLVIEFLTPRKWTCTTRQTMRIPSATAEGWIRMTWTTVEPHHRRRDPATIGEICMQFTGTRLAVADPRLCPRRHAVA